MTSEQRLAGKVIFISGGASGIGLATALYLLANGARVTIGDIDLAAAERAARDTPDLHAVPLDVASDASWTQALQAARARFGRLDGLVNNAGVFLLGNIETTTDEEWRRTQSINVDGVFFGCRRGVAALKAGGGSIVNISSVAGLIGGANILAYNASKGAVRLLTKSVALHCARKGYGIRCNSVHPTFVDRRCTEERSQRREIPPRRTLPLRRTSPSAASRNRTKSPLSSRICSATSRAS